MAFALPRTASAMKTAASAGGLRLPVADKAYTAHDILNMTTKDAVKLLAPEHLDKVTPEAANKPARETFAGLGTFEKMGARMFLGSALAKYGITTDEFFKAASEPARPPEKPKAPGVPLPPSPAQPAPAAPAAKPNAPVPAPAPAPAAAAKVPTPVVPPPAPAASASAVPVPPAPVPAAGGKVASLPPAAAVKPPVPSRMPAYKHAISGIESGGNYGSLGKVLKNGDQALGKYQIMQSNLAQWSKEALGQPITREQFLKSPELQDKIFEHRFGKYVQQYGEEGAARAWYAGEKGMHNLNATDVHGRLTVANYGKDFMAKLATAPPEQPISRNFMDTGRGNEAGITSEGEATAPGGPAIKMPKLETKANDDVGIYSSGEPTGPAPTMPDASPTAVAGGDGGGAAAAGKGFDFGGLGDAFSGLGGALGKSAGAGTGSVGSTLIPMAQHLAPSAPVPIVDPRLLESQKQQLALAMQRLNSGKLF